MNRKKIKCSKCGCYYKERLFKIGDNYTDLCLKCKVAIESLNKLVDNIVDNFNRKVDIDYYDIIITKCNK